MKPAAASRAPAAARFVDSHLGHLLGQANHALYQGFDAQLRAAGLSPIAWRVLATLHDSEPLTISQLAAAVLSKQPTVTKLVQRMAAQRWVTLLADASDQRCTRVAATAAGRRVVLPLVDAARTHEARVLRELAAAEKAALRRLLARVAQHA